jgi:hypothetical protein
MNSLKSILAETPTKELKRAANSPKEYLYFDISVFNVGANINIICTNRFRTPSPRTWNGYDFIIENNFENNELIKQELQTRKNK